MCYGLHVEAQRYYMEEGMWDEEDVAEPRGIPLVMNSDYT